MVVIISSVIVILLLLVIFLFQIIKNVGFKGNFKEFLDMLRTEKRFYFDTKVPYLPIIFLCCYFV